MNNDWRNYSLADGGSGFDPDQWYSSPVPRKQLKELMRRENGPALANYALWLSLVVITGIWVWTSWGTLAVVPALFLYGIFYGSCADSRWHECSHGTIFLIVSMSCREQS